MNITKYLKKLNVYGSIRYKSPKIITILKQLNSYPSLDYETCENLSILSQKDIKDYSSTIVKIQEEIGYEEWYDYFNQQ